MDFHLDRHALVVTTFARERREDPDLAYWRLRPAAERLAAVEFLRRQFIELAADFDKFCALLIARGT